MLVAVLHVVLCLASTHRKYKRRGDISTALWPTGLHTWSKQDAETRRKRWRLDVVLNLSQERFHSNNKRQYRRAAWEWRRFGRRPASYQPPPPPLTAKELNHVLSRDNRGSYRFRQLTNSSQRCCPSVDFFCLMLISQGQKDQQNKPMCHTVKSSIPLSCGGHFIDCCWVKRKSGHMVWPLRSLAQESTRIR